MHSLNERNIIEELIRKIDDIIDSHNNINDTREIDHDIQIFLKKYGHHL